MQKKRTKSQIYVCLFIFYSHISLIFLVFEHVEYWVYVRKGVCVWIEWTIAVLSFCFRTLFELQWTQCNRKQKTKKVFLFPLLNISFSILIKSSSQRYSLWYRNFRILHFNFIEKLDETKELITRFKFYPADNIGFKIQHPKNSRKWLYNKAPANLLKIPKSARRSRKGGRKDRNPGCGAYAKQGTGVHGAVA